MNILQFHRNRAEHDTEHQESYACDNDDHSDAYTQRIEQDKDGKKKHKDSSYRHPCSTGESECIKIPAERDYKETVVQQADTHDDRQSYEGDARIDAEEDTDKKVYDASDNKISPHHQVIAAGSRNDQLSCTDHQHQNTEEDAESHITFQWKDEHRYSKCYAEYACKQQEPPMPDCTGGPVN